MLSTIQKLMFAFVTLIIGLVFVGQIAVVTEGPLTSLQTSSETINLVTLGVKNGSGWINESLKVYPTHWSEAASGWRADSSDCATSAPYVMVTAVNGSGTALTDPTDWVRNNAGYVTFKQSALINDSAGNTTVLTEQYCADSFLTADWQRTVLQLVPGFFALALLIFSVGMFYSVAKESGII